MSGVGARLGEGPALAPPSSGRLPGPARWRTVLLLVLPLAATAARYHPLTGNYFFGDDFLNLYHLVDDPLPRYLVTPNGGHALLARNAIFWLTWLAAGTDPRPYFWTVLLTHLVNVALLFGVIRVMTGSTLLASFGAALWGTSPLHEGTLGWYSVYGHVLVGSAVLVILYQASRAAETSTPPTRAVRAGWYVLALVAASCFGSGTAIAIVLPFVLWLLLPPHVRGQRVPLLSLVVTVPLLYVGQVWAYEHLSGIELHSASVLAKLVTDGAAILWFGMALVAFGLTRLLAGPFPPGPPAVWYAVLAGFAVVTVVVARSADPAPRRRLLACAVLVLTAYGIIALGRAALVVLMTGNAVDAVRLTPRYQYVGQLLLTVLLCMVLARLGELRPVARKGALLAPWYVVMLLGHVVWSAPIEHHDDARAGAAEVVDAINTAVGKAPPGGAVRIANLRFVHMPLPPVLFPGWAAVFTIFFPDDVVDGRRVYFVERDPAVIGALRSGRRTGSLLVPP